jgi:UDP-glucose 4-epimerase
MKILIIGGNGFIGLHLAEILCKDNKVIIFDKKILRKKIKNISYVKGDILNLNQLKKNMHQVDIVYNFAAIADIDIAANMPLQTAEINILGSLNIFKACLEKKVKKIIHASTIYVDSNEGNFYAISKRCAEDYLLQYSKNYKLNYTILRFGSLYGERADKNNGIERIINTLIKRKKLIYRGTSKASRKYIYVKDAVKACKKVINKKYDNQCLTITGNKLFKIKDIMLHLKKRFNIKSVNFLNEKNTSHYNTKPIPYKKILSKNFTMRKETPFLKKIEELVEIKGKK